ncbi:hypothetical protein DL96DRAFT_1821251 [Flagelloscypha sp. PMI_526]|nr:hypothetical protein DL96DRAFT_1821251 [Flagelloscypha sp. PMI_526]
METNRYKATFPVAIPPELPERIVQHILTIVFLPGTFQERREMLCLSKDIYSYLAQFVYRVIQIDSPRPFEEFLSWMQTKSDDFLKGTIKALHVNLLMWCPSERNWTALLSRLHGLQSLFIFCSDWIDHDCLLAAWRAIFVLPELSSLRLDWHFNAASLTIPPPYIYPCYSLQTVTHLTIVGNSNHNFGLSDIIQFRVLSHLAIINPMVGYSRDDILHWVGCLIRLRLMVILVFGNEGSFISGFDQTEKIVGFVGVGDASSEFRNHVKGGETIWTRGEAILENRLQGIKFT